MAENLSRELPLSADDLEREFERLRPLIIKFYTGRLYRFTNRHQLAEDLAQDTLLRAFKYLGRFNYNSQFSTWVYSIMRNILFDFLRRQVPKENRTVGLEEMNEDMSEFFLQNHSEEKLIKAIDLNRKRERLHRVLPHLNGAEIALLQMRGYDGMTLQRMADTLGVPLATAKTRYYKVLEKIQDLKTI